ncbi:hypothetical protein BLS_008013 [Venturia inaequalis]|uniref:Zn(2)-C6 fungal-type domain-containing protein n=1 Tax=Venturia inaequalis TaxID=5025 RepID=A0A8H3YNT2_VENIN|nr:hypothetical protein BLS_008013 [Venturia inaequalis]
MSTSEAPAPLSKRSCLPCYQRKLKCDKKKPCTRCATRGERCDYFLGPIRRNRGPKARPNAIPEAVSGSLNRLKSVLAIRDGKANTVTIYNADPALLTETDLLVIDGSGKSRLLSAVGWASFMDESTESPNRLLTPDNAEDSFDPPGPAPLFMPVFNQESLMSGTPGCSDQRAHVPNPLHLPKYWEVFVQNVDPMVRLLHKPSIEILLSQVKKSGLTSCSPASYALIASICFAAVNSMRAQGVQELFREDQKTLSRSLGQAVEQALFRAKLSQTHDIVALQAFTILITCTPPDPSRATWTMIGLALRIATSMGLHRDGSNFGLSPFECEVRRRLWWHLMLIDIRTSEDFASNPYPYANNRVRVPANVNDEDMDLNSKTEYTSKIGLTEMSPSLIRSEGCQFILGCIAIGQDSQHQYNQYEGKSSSEQSFPCKIIPISLIEQFEQDLHDKFIDFADADVSIAKNRLVSSMARLALLKMKVLLGVFHLRKGKMSMQVETAKYADALFDNSVSLLEAQSDLQNGEDFTNWFWLLKNYNQWHSMAVVLTQILSEINKMSNPSEDILPPNLRKAWSIADLTFQQSEAVGIYDKMWGPLSSLRKKVADKLRPKPTEGESPPTLSFDANIPSFGMEDIDWAQPSLWTDLKNSTSWVDVGSTPWVDFGSAPQNVSSSTENNSNSINDPWPMYFPTNLFTGSGM